ncbi:glycoside hydrolase, putative [Bodo saltans]|uniref:Glycoside hydrolase, putative n=1 Tax=Bodo saltans TaxID=75058 RepID=A0A0S4J936_BODSA|nr:glycoside hydrolase, putative [Bodo saltans]|eukprot:CUG86863.1 glycoside hydrolase, putative [Bodo saltans]
MHHYFTNSGNRGEHGYWNGLGMTIYGPNVNLVRDPRWGRNQEVYSEDPRHTSKLMEGYVGGMQQDRDGYMLAASCCKHFAAYDVENFPTERYVYNAIVDGRNLWETYLPAFEACVKDASVAHIMCSYNSINGVPTCGSDELMNGILRGKFNFSGFVVSDYDAWANIFSSHHYCPNMTCAAAVGINAGLDQEGGGDGAINQLGAAIQAGKVANASVTASFRRLFHARIVLGMFDPPSRVPFSNVSFTDISSPKHMQLSLAAAREAMCLYKNKNSVLPLTPGKKIAVIGPKAGATTWLQGNYAEAPTWGVVSVLEGILGANAPLYACSFDSVGIDYHLANDSVAAANSAEACALLCASDLSCNYFTYVDGWCYSMPTMDNARITQNMNIQSGARPGLCFTQPGVDHTGAGDVPAQVTSDVRECCQLCRATPNCTLFTFNSILGCYLNPTGQALGNPFATSGSSSAKVGNVLYAPGCLDGLACNDTALPAAAEAAEAADATVIVLGLDQTMECEGMDRHSIDLPAGQYALFDAVRAAAGSKPVVLVLVHGGTVALKGMLGAADAVIDAWYPGQQGGNGLADVIYGFYNPGGKSTATYYESDSDLPPNLAQQDLYHGNGITYRYYNGTPVVPFGHGLSYTNFTYSNLRVANATVGPCDVLSVTVDVTNTGAVIGDEVVQFYLKQVNASVPVPALRLADFTRLKGLAPQQTVTVTLRATPAYRAVVINSPESAYAAQRMLEPGMLELWVGGGQPGYATTLGASATAIGSANLDTCS